LTITREHVTPDAEVSDIHELAQQLRVDAIRASTAAGSGHPTSSMSAADLMAVLMARHLRYDWQRPDNPANDHLIFSKGHASPLLYAMFKAAGVIGDDELMTTYRRGGRLQGHPTPELPWVDVATGSLGQGIGYAVGVALAGNAIDKLPYHVWTLCGDSEMAEGSVWEALDKASHFGLANFTAIVDVNRLGQVGPTEYGWDTGVYERRVAAFGCRPLVIDGHDLREIDGALREAAESDGPTVVIARTVKGYGVAEVADKEGWHGKAMPPDLAERAVAELGGVRNLAVTGQPPRSEARPAGSEQAEAEQARLEPPRYETGAEVATRVAFGDALTVLAARPDVVVLDGEVGNSTGTEKFRAVRPERHFQMFIAEQQMIASAVGLAVRGQKAYAATFAAFLSRAHDFLRMAAISGIDLRLSGSHCGVEIGPDGPSQMGLEDLSMMRALPGSTVLYPSDATSAAALTLAMADTPGISYLRTTRGAYPVLYPAGTDFPVGGSKVWGATADDQATLIGAGVTVHECLKAAQELARLGIPARVLDAYSVKPLDDGAVRENARQTGMAVVVEDHHPEGGVGEAVARALVGLPVCFAHLAVRDRPGSTSPEKALDHAGLTARHIVAAVRRHVEARSAAGEHKPTLHAE
jgi:transketolase